MRRKAEKQIRKAVISLGRSQLYRIDKVREKTNLIRKVFDKTILDMARVGTIELLEGDLVKMTGAEISGMIQKGDFVYMYLSFFESFEELELKMETGAESQNDFPAYPAVSDPAVLSFSFEDPPAVEHEGESQTPVDPVFPDQKQKDEEPETMDIILMGIEKEEWERFEMVCRDREGKSGIRKIVEMIHSYNRS